MKMTTGFKVACLAAGLAASGSLLAAAPTLTTEVAVNKLELPWDMAF